MGNKNISPKINNSMSTSTKTLNSNRSNQSKSIDLDEIVEEWIWYMWNRTKIKSMSHYKRDDLLIKINWKGITFTQSDVQFNGAPPVYLPYSQVLYRTNFNNRTNIDQTYLLKTERSSRSIFKFEYMQSLTKSKESCLMFRLPEDIVEVGGGIKHEQSIGFGQDTTKEYNMNWNVSSQIRVPPHTRVDATLNIDEEEYKGDFSLLVRFFGRITATISTRKNPDVYLTFMDGDIVQIIYSALQTKPQLTGFEIIEGNPTFVQYTMRGRCSFRYGIKQHVLLNQESLEPRTTRIQSKIHIPSLNIDNQTYKKSSTSSNDDFQVHFVEDDV